MLSNEDISQRDDGPRIAFLHLVMFFTLWIWAWALCAVLRDWVDRSFPSTLSVTTILGATDSRSEWIRKILAGELAALLIAFPCFLYTNSVIAQVAARMPELESSAVRRWLIYISLFCTAAVLLGDAIEMLYTLFVGTFTLAFFFKMVIHIIVMGGIFFYYLGSMDPRSIAGPLRFPDRDPIFLILSCVGVALGLVIGMVDFGNMKKPAHAADPSSISAIFPHYSPAPSHMSAPCEPSIPSTRNAGNAPSRPDWNGLHLRTRSGCAYVVIDGTLHWIPNAATGSKLFNSWDAASRYEDHLGEKIAGGWDISADAMLASQNGDPKVYLVLDQYHLSNHIHIKRWIVNPDAFNKYDFNWSSIRHLPAGHLNPFPNGADIR